MDRDRAGPARLVTAGPRPTTILLVEPDAGARQVLAHRLSGISDRVIHAGTVEDGLALCDTHAVDLVVVMARVPPPGATALRAEMRRRRGPPVVAYRVGVEPDAHIRWLEGGGADCLSGDDPALLAARCRAVLRRSRELRPLPPAAAPPVGPGPGP